MFVDKGTSQVVALLLQAGFRDLGSAEQSTLLGKVNGKPYSKVAPVLFSGLGPGFAKLGQILASRGAELIAPQYQAPLDTLSEQGEEVPHQQITARIRQQLGARAANIVIEQKALGVGSIGQTHRATLTEPGQQPQKVVVKVIKPGATQGLRRNLATMTQALGTNAATGSFRAVFKELEQHVALETDLRHEEKAINRARAPLSKRGFATVPDVLAAYTAEKVLVEKPVEGESIAKNMPLHRERTARGFFKEVLAQIFEDGFVHGDPHLGNVFNSKKELRTFLDWGLHGEVKKDDQVSLTKVAMAVGTGHVAGIVDALEKMSRGSKIDSKALSDGVQTVLDAKLGAGQTIQRVVLEAQKAGANVPSGVVWSSKALFQAEGLAKRLDPKFSAKSAVIEYVAKRALTSWIPRISAAAKP